VAQSVALDRVSRLDHDCVVLTVVARAYKRLGLTLPDGEWVSPIEKARVLETYFLTHTQPDKLATCDNCHGQSDVAYPGCPFCGDADTGGLVPATLEQVDALDEALKAIAAYRYEIATSMWALGMLLLRVRNTRLYRVRRDENGKQKYRSFGEWVKREAKMAIGWAYELMETAQHFAEADVRSIGPSKLSRILRAPKEAREELTALARAGATRRELDARGRLAKAELPPKPRSRIVHFDMPRDVVYSVPLMARHAPKERAHALHQLPVGVLKLPGDSCLFVQVHKGADGALTASVRAGTIGEKPNLPASTRPPTRA
jgi:hypothetical protein